MENINLDRMIREFFEATGLDKVASVVDNTVGRIYTEIKQYLADIHSQTNLNIKQNMSELANYVTGSTETFKDVPAAVRLRSRIRYLFPKSPSYPVWNGSASVFDPGNYGMAQITGLNYQRGQQVGAGCPCLQNGGNLARDNTIYQTRPIVEHMTSGDVIEKNYGMIYQTTNVYPYTWTVFE